MDRTNNHNLLNEVKESILKKIEQRLKNDQEFSGLFRE